MESFKLFLRQQPWKEFVFVFVLFFKLLLFVLFVFGLFFVHFLEGLVRDKWLALKEASFFMFCVLILRIKL